MEVGYPIPPRGLATNFSEAETPPDYALKFRNRFINADGSAEKRQGITQLGDTVAGLPTFDAIHELVQKDGTAILFVSGQGKVWRLVGAVWTLSHSIVATGTLNSVQMADRLIFFTNDAETRNFYTKDGVTFSELKAIVERGVTATGTDRNTLEDADITNWATDTLVAANDLLFNATLSAYAVITSLTSASATHSEISSSTASIIGRGTRDQAVGDRYEIIDLVELNVIPTDTVDDNTATINSDSSANGLFVSAVPSWVSTEARVGDWVYNSTRTAIAQVTAVSTAQLQHTGIVGQVAGDTIILMKSAMPVTTRGHLFAGRLYMIDQRDQTKVRISGPNNPEDMSTDAATLDSTSFNFGTLHPRGDTVQAMESYQRFFCISGKNNTFLFQGTVPTNYPVTTTTTSADSSDFGLIGLFPKGVVSTNGLVSVGNDLAMLTVDGVESISLVGDASTLGRANLSEAIRNKLRELLDSNSDAQMFHYPKRSWLCVKVGTEIYVFNYTPYFGRDQLSRSGKPSSGAGSWSVFDGPMATQNAYFVRSDGDLVVAGAGGKVYLFDQGSYTDDGAAYSTELQTSWLTLEKGRPANIKKGNYIRPIIDTSNQVAYTITAEGGFGLDSTETITVSTSGGSQAIGQAIVGQAQIGGTSVIDGKHALRWRGKEMRLTFKTDDALGPDVLSRYHIYFTKHGVR